MTSPGVTSDKMTVAPSLPVVVMSMPLSELGRYELTGDVVITVCPSELVICTTAAGTVVLPTTVSPFALVEVTGITIDLEADGITAFVVTTVGEPPPLGVLVVVTGTMTPGVDTSSGVDCAGEELRGEDGAPPPPLLAGLVEVGGGVEGEGEEEGEGLRDVGGASLLVVGVDVGEELAAGGLVELSFCLLTLRNSSLAAASSLLASDGFSAWSLSTAVCSSWYTPASAFGLRMLCTAVCKLSAGTAFSASLNCCGASAASSTSSTRASGRPCTSTSCDSDRA